MIADQERLPKSPELPKSAEIEKATRMIPENRFEPLDVSVLSGQRPWLCDPLDHPIFPIQCDQ